MMHENNLNALVTDAFKNPDKPFERTKVDMKDLFRKNQMDLSTVNLPSETRIPTAEELEEMRRWAVDYKKFYKRASKREVRRAVQKHFNIKIYR